MKANRTVAVDLYYTNMEPYNGRKKIYTRFNVNINSHT